MIGGRPFFSRYLFVCISARVGISTFLPNFFCKVFHNFVITGLKTLSNSGVAAAPAVATTAIATVVEKFLPSTNQATTTLAVAVIATAGAAATPLILRIVKPIITKIYKTIQKKLGKKVELPTRAEIQTNKYREKKGLPPLKKK